MTNASVARFSIINRAMLPLPCRRKFEIVAFTRNFSTCTSPFACSSSYLVCPPTTFVLNGRLAASDVSQRSEEWFTLRKDKLTTSTTGTALGMWKGKRRYELWHEKVFPSNVQLAEPSKNNAMEWGVLNEAAAIERYKTITDIRIPYPAKIAPASREFRTAFATGSPLLIRTPIHRGKSGHNSTSVSVRCEQSTKEGSGLDVWLGRFAMIGFAAAITVEVATGKGLLENFGLTSPLPTVALAVTALVGVLTAVFIFQSASKN